MNADFLDLLRATLPEHALLVEPEDLHPYECDDLSVYRQLTLAVCLPETEAQVQQSLKICHQHAVSVMARGAGTGLSGGRAASRQWRDYVAGAPQSNNRNLCRGSHCTTTARSAQSGYIRCGGDKFSRVFHLMPSALLAIQRRIKHCFDPQGVFNSCRLIQEF